MAVGTAYPNPESGWTRIETLDDHYRYLAKNNINNYYKYNDAYSNNDRILEIDGVLLKFKGTGFRIIHTKMDVQDETNDVYLDNIYQGYYTCYVASDLITTVCGFEVVSLEDREHVLKIIPRGYFRWDCVDIKGTALYIPNETLNLY